VIAPEIPGVTGGYDSAPRSFDELAEWSIEVLSELDAPKAHVVGNSLGASIAWQMCTRHPRRAHSLVMVNGFPPSPLNSLMRLALKLHPFRRLALNSLQEQFYSPRTINTAFVTPSVAPAEIREFLDKPPSPALDLMLDRMCSVRTRTEGHDIPTLFLWGEKDQLPAVTVTDAYRYQSMKPGAKLALIPGAGHLPQVENSEAFLEKLTGFLQNITVSAN
jgi:pimeloyl-ACP methyl ester carboxylesterase